MITSAAPDPASAITDFFEGAATVLEETGFIDPCPIGTVAREVASVNDGLRHATHTVITGWVATATELFERAGIDHDEAAELAVALVAAIEGGFVVSRAAGDAGPMRATGRRMRVLVEATVASAAISR